MAISIGYIPAPDQENVFTRTTMLGIEGLERFVVPTYEAATVEAGGGVPGVIGIYDSQIVFVHDDGTLTVDEVSTAMAPLVAAETAATAVQEAEASALADLNEMNAGFPNVQAQAQLDLAVLNASNDPLAPILTRVLEAQLQGGQALLDALGLLNLIEP